MGTFLEKYFKSLKQGPNHECVPCSRLWFKKSVRMYTFAEFAKLNVGSEFLKEVCFKIENDGIHVGYTCSTCARNIGQKKIPSLCVAKNNELKFPVVPQEGLSSLEAIFFINSNWILSNS